MRVRIAIQLVVLSLLGLPVLLFLEHNGLAQTYVVIVFSGLCFISLAYACKKD